MDRGPPTVATPGSSHLQAGSKTAHRSLHDQTGRWLLRTDRVAGDASPRGATGDVPVSRLHGEQQRNRAAVPVSGATHVAAFEPARPLPQPSVCG